MKNLIVQVNPQLEFINSILLTSRYNEITRQFIGYGLMTDEINEYTSSIKSYFEKYRQETIYSFIEEMIPNGFTFSRPVELALCLDYNFSMRFNPSALCIKYCGGFSKIKELISLLRDFADRCKYFEFFNREKIYYKPFIQKVNADIQVYPYIELLENEYGKEQNSYNYVLSSLMNGNYGIHFTDKETQKSDMFSVFTTDDFSLSPAIFFHEYSHPFINPLTEKYSDAVENYRDAYEALAKYRLPDYQSGYGDLHECINEHLVRAMAIHLLKKCQLSDMANELMNGDLYRGYRYIPQILERYDYYDKNRTIYSDFEAFYPELLKVFSSLV